MFVDITEEKKPLEAEKLYNRCYRQGEEITPEICMEVLRSTNYAACMKRMLECVERLPKEKQAAFKDVVLATFEGREQPDEVREIGEMLAEKSGYVEEFTKTAVDEEEGTYLRSGAEALLKKPLNNFYCTPEDLAVEPEGWQNLSGYMFRSNTLNGVKKARFTGDEVQVLDLDERPEYMSFTGKCVKFSVNDLQGVKNIEFAEGVDLRLGEAKNLPAFVNIKPKKFECYSCDFAGVEQLRVRGCELAKVGFVQNLPRDTSFSQVKQLRFINIDLNDSFDDTRYIKFDNIGYVMFRDVRNLKGTLDLQTVDCVQFVDMDISGIDDLKLGEKTKVEFSGLRGDLSKVDFSRYSSLALDKVDLSFMDELKFKDGASVGLARVKLPKKVDLSNLKSVESFWEQNLENVSELVVADKEQYQAFMKRNDKKPAGLKVRYAGEDAGLMAQLKRRFKGR